MPLEGAQQTAARRVPELDLMIVTRRRDAGAVRRELNGIDIRTATELRNELRARCQFVASTRVQRRKRVSLRQVWIQELVLSKRHQLLLRPLLQGPLGKLGHHPCERVGARLRVD